MNRDDIIRMAREACDKDKVDAWQNGFWVLTQEEVERFFHMAQAAEREACEALYEHEDVQAPVGNSAWGEAYQEGWIAGAQAYREAIRARGQA
jgi:hypothetical protein